MTEWIRRCNLNILNANLLNLYVKKLRMVSSCLLPLELAPTGNYITVTVVSKPSNKLLGDVLALNT